ncbi:MAG: 4Fe-4S binding protein, partial [Calditerrivibrio sp.]|nr:4Fe-4S binding protein [Calditerrivibrio sp.]
PFIIIHKNINLKDKILTTDVNCPSVRRIFGYINVSLEKVIGITFNKPNSNLFYVGNLSNVNNKLLPMMKNIEFIFLNDGVGSVNLPTVSKISKFKTSNVVFPYSCNNISKSSPIKVNTKKCICFKKNEKPHCVSGTLCPALQEINGAMSINEKFCVGCRLCETSCPYGAI